jgi:predicted DNA-binding WGR domain protein
VRRFELVSGTSSKFWEYEVRDASLEVRFGRIGSAGQTRTKALASPEAARAAAEKLVREKLREGYVERSAGDPRADRLREAYGFDFPDQLFAFWRFAEPLRAKLLEVLGISLCGPFDVLAGRFDDGWPDLPMLLHMRFRLDPPEFFTVMLGNTDGEEWGLYADDPEHGPFCVAHYYRNRTRTSSTCPPICSRRCAQSSRCRPPTATMTA